MTGSPQRLPNNLFGQKLQTPISTKELELRPFCDSDTDSIAALLADHEATRFIGGTKTRHAATESVRTMRDAFAKRGWGTLAMFERGKPLCIGYCGVRPLLHTSELEVAFALRREFWNRGYATEAARASIDAAFNTLKIESLCATVYPDNRASIRVLEKLRMTLESEVFGSWPFTTALLYRVTRRDWTG